MCEWINNQEVVGFTVLRLEVSGNVLLEVVDYCVSWISGWKSIYVAF